MNGSDGYDEIIYDVADPVAVITLNRPERLNAWTPTITREVRDAVGRAERDRRVVGIVLTGAGRGFCAGADLTRLDAVADGTADASAAWQDGGSVVPGDVSWGADFRGAYTWLMSVPKPVIAAINGPIAGMAVAIALCCDLRFMAEDAVLTTSFAERGLIAEWGISWLLPRLVGPAIALDLLWSARKIDGRTAARLGLVNAALPAGEVVMHAREYLGDLARRCSPAAMAVMKRQVYQQLHAGLGAAEREAAELMRATFTSTDFRAGIAAFRAKLPAAYPRLGSE